MSDQPIIIKRIKKGGHAAHGGAWKVAYADFVTAMMAFFLLLWLLSSTSEEQKEGIAEYFAPTVGLKGEMGIGVEGGESPNKEGIKKTDLSTEAGIVYGAPPVGEFQKDIASVSDVDASDESKAFDSLEEELKEALENDPVLKEFKDHILVENTPEGLRIQILDQEKVSMFKRGSAELEPYAKDIMKKLAGFVEHVPNNISISGHTDATKYADGAKYSNWELSSDRANASRKFFIGVGVPEGRLFRVTGYADKQPLLPSEPGSPRNRRIGILLLKHDLAPYDKPATDELMAPPKVERSSEGNDASAPEKIEEAPRNPEEHVEPVMEHEGAALQRGVKEEFKPVALPSVPVAVKVAVNPVQRTVQRAPVEPRYLSMPTEELGEAVEDPTLDEDYEPSRPQRPSVRNEVRSLEDPGQFGVFR